VDHLAPGAISEELYRGVLDGHGRAVFNGKVVVAKHAVKTDAQQANHNLLLSRGAEIDTKPELEIYADDVKCSHGASIGQLDEQQLFYLRSRGLDAVTARGLLIYAFADRLVSRLPHAALCAHVHRLLSTAVSQIALPEPT
jgi:Fe-S cluster assembly protein SufD